MKKYILNSIPTNHYSSNLALTQRSESKRTKPLGDLCLEIAEFAKDRDYRTLDHLLRMAAAEAYEQTSSALPLSGKNELIGFWEWDVSNNLTYVDPPAARMFDINPKASVRGLPVEAYIKAIHPDDVASFTRELYRVVKEGGCYKATYRVISNGTVSWIFAKGSCFVGPGKVPVRFPGALFDVTASMAG
jgi:PAS domain-containing protein